MLDWFIGYLLSAGFWATMLVCIFLNLLAPDTPVWVFAFVGLAFSFILPYHSKD